MSLWFLKRGVATPANLLRRGGVLYALLDNLESGAGSTNKRAVTTSGEAIKHVEGRKVVFTAASVAAEPIVILVDLEETFTTSTGSSGHQKSPDERSLTMCRRIHMEMPVGEVCFQELKNVPEIRF